jgi:glutaredoxin 3
MPEPTSNTSKPRVKVYTTSYCGWCRRTEEILRRNGVAFEVVDVTGDDDARHMLVELAYGRRTVPVIFIDGVAIGGYEELARLFASGGMDALKPKASRAA